METEQIKIVSAYENIESGLAVVREKLKKVPDASTDEGYEEIVKTMKVKRDLKKELLAAHKGTKAEALAFCRLVDGEKNRILTSLEESFAPHKEAKDVEDERKARIEQEEADAAAELVKAIQKRKY